MSLKHFMDKEKKPRLSKSMQEVVVPSDGRGIQVIRFNMQTWRAIRKVIIDYCRRLVTFTKYDDRGFHPTMDLRLVQDPIDECSGFTSATLQQLFRDKATGEGEWRNVQIVDAKTASSTEPAPPYKANAKKICKPKYAISDAVTQENHDAQP